MPAYRPVRFLPDFRQGGGRGGRREVHIGHGPLLGERAGASGNGAPRPQYAVQLPRRNLPNRQVHDCGLVHNGRARVTSAEVAWPRPVHPRHRAADVQRRDAPARPARPPCFMHILLALSRRFPNDVRRQCDFACYRPSVLMQGFPPAPDARVTLANWQTPPYNRWAFSPPARDRPHAADRAAVTARCSRCPRTRSRWARWRPCGRTARAPAWTPFCDDTFTDGVRRRAGRPSGVRALPRPDHARTPRTCSCRSRSRSSAASRATWSPAGDARPSSS